MHTEFDALVIGAGPAGSATAIGLAQSGWRVAIVEQHAYPRRKVCGESLSAAGLELLDLLGVGAAYRTAAGPELDQVGWMGAEATVVAAFPACAEGPYRVGRALSREHLDPLLLERARALGARLFQPARVRGVVGTLGRYECLLETAAGTGPARYREQRVAARVVIAAHGSWGPEPAYGSAPQRARPPERRGDLFAFKANFLRADLARGLLSVIAFDGGYGGIVEAENGLATLACCIRRDALAACRDRYPGLGAGSAVEAALRDQCAGVYEALQSATRVGPWLAVGPIRPGIRVGRERADPLLAGVFRVGNAAGETHPLIGEGITMALHSAGLLARRLGQESPRRLDASRAGGLQSAYETEWRQAFTRRLRFAAVYSQLAMRPKLARVAGAGLRLWPRLLTEAARRAGKARRAGLSLTWHEECV